MNKSNHKPVRALKKSTNVRSKPAPRLPALLRAAGWLASLTSSAAAARLVITLFTLPRRRRRPANESSLLATGVRFRLRLPSGKRAWAWSWGAGPVVALAHGWEGRGAQLARFVKPLVDRGYRVVAFDAPAHGESAGTRTDLREFAGALLALARREAGLHAVIAHSMGGLALALAVRKGLAIERSVLLAAPSSPADSLAWLGGQLHAGDDAMAIVHERFGRYVGMPWEEFAAGGVYDAMQMPALFVHDRDDAICRVEKTRAVAARIGARYVETRGLGHNRLLKDPDVVETALSFLSEGRRERGRADGWHRFLDEVDTGFEMQAWA
jgi:pimeloyl-ACP methyl ester carboxylesterase